MQPHDSHQETGEQSSNQESGVITALLGSASQILERYATQWETSKDMLRAEWAITRKCIWFAIVVLIVFSGVVLSACLGLTVLASYGLYTLGMPVWGIGLLLAVLHIIAMIMLVQTMRGLIKRMGFKKSSQLFTPSLKGEQ